MAEDTEMGDTTTSTGQADTEAGNVDTVLTGDASNTDQDTGEGGQADDNKEGGEGDAGDTGVPETYAFNIPEGMELDQAFADAMSPVFKDAALSQDQVDKIVSGYAAHSSSSEESVSEAFNQQLDTWATELKQDSEFGGESYDENVAVARKAISEFGSEELHSVLQETGLGSHPALVKFAHTVGKFLVEDGGGPRGTANSGGTELSREDRLYGPNGGRKAAG